MSRPVTTTNEFGKVLQAAGVPEGPGPGWADLRAGWGSRRPPLALAVAGVLGALTPVALVALTVLVVVRAVTSDAGLFGRVVLPLLLGGILLGLAALAWRGVARAVHVGDTTGLYFPARVVGFLCVPIGGFLLFWTQVRGNPAEASMAAPFLFLALTALPLPLLAVPAVRRWPLEVLLRRGPTVRSRLEATAFLEARPHRCGRVVGVGAGELQPVQDAERTGLVLRGVCGHCGLPFDYVFADAAEPARARADDPLALGARGSRSALGGGDLHHLGKTLAVPRDLDPAAATTEDLQRVLVRGAVAVQATVSLLELVPRARKGVPIWRLSGHVVPLGESTRELTRSVLTARLEERRASSEQVYAELVRRGVPAPPLPW